MLSPTRSEMPAIPTVDMAAPTLLSLPPEILVQIMRGVRDHKVRLRADPAIQAFTLTCRAFARMSDILLRRSIDITMCDQFLPPDMLAEDRRRARTPAVIAHNQAVRENALNEKITNLIDRGNARRWRLVQKITITAESGVLPLTFQLLDLVKPNIRSLEFRHVYPPRPEEVVARHSDPDAFDVRLLRSGMSFPSLTRLTFLPGAVRYPEIIPLLCASAVNLKGLEIVFEAPLGCLSDVSAPLPTFPLFIGDTKLEQLDLDIHAPLLGRHDILRTLLERSPLLRTLQMRLHTSEVEWGVSMLSIAGELPNLADLVVSGMEPALNRVQSSGSMLFAKLRWLVMKASSWTNTLNELPAFTNLEVALFNCSGFGVLSPFLSIGQPPPSPVQQMGVVTIAALRRCPRLRHVAFTSDFDVGGIEQVIDEIDEFENMGYATAHISSIRNGEKELLIANVEMMDIEVDDAAVRAHYDPTWLSSRKRIITSFNRTFPLDLYIDSYSDPTRQLCSDFEGTAVPAEIIDEMLRVDGQERVDGFQSHVGMGSVQVGDEAWRVLTDWRDGAVAVAAV